MKLTQVLIKSSVSVTVWQFLNGEILERLASRVTLPSSPPDFINSMKQLIQQFAHGLGYHISRVESGPFAELKRLCAVENPIIFDVGAHHGQTVKQFRQDIPKARIFSFEPFPDSFEILKNRTSQDRETTIFNYGLSDREGECTFHANTGSSTNSLLPTDDLGSKTWGDGVLETEEIIQAKFRTLDSVMTELSLPQVDILKLDVQGAEHLVLKGSSSACRDGRIRIVYTEIITQPTYVGQQRFDEALKMFHDFGFELHYLYNLSTTSERKLRQLDAIFTRRDA